MWPLRTAQGHIALMFENIEQLADFAHDDHFFFADAALGHFFPVRRIEPNAVDAAAGCSVDIIFP